MGKRTVVTTIPKKNLKKLLRDLPGIFSGEKKSRFGLHKLFWSAFGYKILESIHDAYEVKSFGLPDELGNQWDDLTEEYKAYKRPLSKGEVPNSVYSRARTASKTAKSKRLGILSPSQHRYWQKTFGVLYHTYKHKMPDSIAKELAAQIAWTRTKEIGGLTKIGTLGKRNLLLMRVTDKLYVSLSPGNLTATGYQKKSRDQIFVISKGTLTIGTKVPYAQVASQKRPLWPEDISKWIDGAVEFAMETVLEKIQSIVR